MRASTGGTGTRTRVPAFDGLRGLAVIAVVLFHAEVTGARGGFLGVSAFFTLSGFLITSLLVSEHRRSRGIGLKRFWAARARRLLPAAFLALGGVLLFGAFAADADQVRDLRGDVFGALGYVANWRFIVDGRVLRRALRAAVAGAALLVAGHRGAVLRPVPAAPAAGLQALPWSHVAARGLASAPPRSVGRALVRARVRHEPRLLRHRHPSGRAPRRRVAGNRVRVDGPDPSGEPADSR